MTAGPRVPGGRPGHVGAQCSWKRPWRDLPADPALSAYDAAYVALAETMRCRLVTNDARLAKGAEQAKSPAQIEVLTA